MNINSVSGQNFLTLGEFGINLKDRGLLLIQGENDDDPSADSNGAGKSSLPDAISWALYGTTARGITGDAVINRKAGKECMVTVVVEDGDTSYYIARYRAPNSLHVRASVHGSTVTTELTKGTQAETQEVINKIMGCSIEVFNAAVYAGQESMPDLPGMTDKQLKLLIEEAAGVEVLADAYKIASTQALAAGKRVTLCSSSVDFLVARENSALANLVTYSEGVLKFDTEKAEKIAQTHRNIKAIALQIKALDKELADMDGPGLNAKIKAFEDTVKASRDATKAQMALASDDYKQAEKELNRISNLKAALERNLMAAERELSHAEDSVGDPCKSCGKPVLVEDVAGIKAALQKKRDIADTELRSFDTSGIAKAQLQLNNANTQIDALQTKLLDTSSELAEYSALTKKQHEYAAEVARRARMVAEAKKLLDSTTVTAAEPNPFVKLVDDATALLVTIRASLVTDRLAHDAALLEHELAEEAAKVFGQSGVRAHILDTVTPFLNARTSEYLGTMTDGNIHAVWNTLQKTAKGELRERFNIEVTNDMGAESFTGMSGGEKRKVRLATTMALQDMVASRAEKPLNIFIADEIDNALDESGLERLMTVLEQKARERGTVLIISHNSLSDWCDQIVTVTKKAGISTISES